MDSELKTKSLIVVLGLGITAVILAMGILIFYIWTPKKKTEDQTLKLGEYTSDYVSESIVVDKYAKDISFLLKNEAYDELYKIVDKSYIDKFDIDREKFEQIMINKGLAKREMKVKSYQKQMMHGKTYYKLILKSVDNKIDARFIIIESFPNIYTLSFDDFLYEMDANKEFINDGFKLTVLKETVRAERINLKVKLENLTNSDIIINSKGFTDPITAKISGEETLVLNDTIGANPYKLAKNDSLVMNVQIKIDDFKHSLLKGLIIKSVNRQNGESVKDLQFPYYLER